MKSTRRRISRELPVFLFFVVLCTAIAIMHHSFMSMSNLRLLGTDAAAVGIISVGMTAVIITGGIDLSIAAVLALSALVGGGIIAQGHMALGILAALGTGLGCGLLNGTLITILRMPPIIATLGTFYIFQAAATLYSGGQNIELDGGQLALLGRGLTPLMITLAVFIVGAIVMRYARTGRYIYAVGGNEEAARLAGIRPTKIKLLVYAISGLLAGVAALVMMGIQSTFQANDAQNYELGAIAAVVIGGTSIMGGEGSILGTLIGVGISTVLANGAILIQLDPQWTKAVIGAAIFAAVAVDRLRKR